MVKVLKDWALLVAMGTGTLFYSVFDRFSLIIPYLLLVMIFVTYCRLSLKDIQIKPLHVRLVIFQLTVSVALFYLFKPLSSLVGEGVLICVLAPTANSAAVITAMLGGNLGTLAAYTLFSNIVMAIAAPILFPLLGIQGDMPFLDSFLLIVREVSPMLLLPLVAALLLSRLAPRLHSFVRNRQSISFYLWSVSLTIVTARTVHFIVEHGRSNILTIVALAMATLVVCLFQFWFGRRIGRKFNDVVSGGQALGQKNTVLAIWMAQAYMQPLTSIGPAAYILWQNSINTFQLWRYRKRQQGH